MPARGEGLPQAAEVVAAESGAVTKALPIAARTLAKVGVAADGITRGYQAYQVEQQFQRGEISDRDRVVAHAKNGGGMAAGWSGATLLGLQGAAWGSALGPFGAAGGGLLGGVAGYFGGEKAAEVVVEYGADAIYAGVNAGRDAAGWIGDRATASWNQARHVRPAGDRIVPSAATDSRAGVSATAGPRTQSHRAVDHRRGRFPPAADRPGRETSPEKGPHHGKAGSSYPGEAGRVDQGPSPPALGTTSAIGAGSAS